MSEGEGNEGRAARVPEPILNNLGACYRVQIANYDQVEDLCRKYMQESQYDMTALEEVVMQLQGRQSGPSRQALESARKGSFSVTFGLYAHGNQFGITRATVEYPVLCEFVNKCIRGWSTGEDHSWTSVSILVNCKSNLHKDNHNHPVSKNVTCSVGTFQKGELWVEAVEGGETLPGHIHWRELPDGSKAPGYVVDTYKKPFAFWPKVYHGAMKWTWEPRIRECIHGPIHNIGRPRTTTSTSTNRISTTSQGESSFGHRGR